jgi:hypothetical protein
VESINVTIDETDGRKIKEGRKESVEHDHEEESKEEEVEEEEEQKQSKNKTRNKIFKNLQRHLADECIRIIHQNKLLGIN